MTFERIAEVNKELKLTKIKGKDYAEVNQRVKAFRMLYPEGTIETELLSFADGVAVVKATVSIDGKILGTGLSYEREGSSLINKTSFLENCETSAVGRALGFVGLGIDTSICSADELDSALAAQGQPIPYNTDGPVKNDSPEAFLTCECCKKEIVETTKKNGEKMSPTETVIFARSHYGKTLCTDCMKKVKKDGSKS